MKFWIQIIMAIVFSGLAKADENFCASKDISGVKNFELINAFIEDHPATTAILKSENLQTNQIIKTQENEVIKIVAETPFRVEFTIYPKSTVKILKTIDPACGLKLEVSGKVFSEGEHLSENSCIEIQTAEVEVIPQGTSYMVESGALNSALASSNEELGLETRDAGDEIFSVKKGTIHVRLRKVYKKKVSIKYTKINLKTRKLFAKNNKNFKKKSKLLAYNGKIKLKAGSSLKVRHNRKRQVADLEVFTPN